MTTVPQAKFNIDMVNDMKYARFAWGVTANRRDYYVYSSNLMIIEYCKTVYGNLSGLIYKLTQDQSSLGYSMSPFVHFYHFLSLENSPYPLVNWELLYKIWTNWLPSEMETMIWKNFKINWKMSWTSLCPRLIQNSGNSGRKNQMIEKIIGIIR